VSPRGRGPVRRYDPAEVRDILLAEADRLVDWLTRRRAVPWSDPSVLPGWTVAELAAHVGTVMRGAAATVRRRSTDRPLTIAQYVAAYAGSRDEVRDWAVEAAAGRAPDDLVDDVRAGRDELAASLTQGPSLPAVVRATRGPLRLADYLVTRVLELVVHTDDLARSIPSATPPEPDKAALRLTTGALVDVLAARAPGHAVELRVPPYAAAQCVEGPRHTRGTPAAVVQTDPVTWIRLAAGRLAWSDAVATGALTASGERSDLRPYLPLL
jgi:uncharacterized protein (TIGR03083 family)